MKKLFTLIMVLVLTGCGSGNNTDSSSTSYSAVSTSQSVSSYSTFASKVRAGNFVVEGYVDGYQSYTDYDYYRFNMVRGSGYCQSNYYTGEISLNYYFNTSYYRSYDDGDIDYQLDSSSTTYDSYSEIVSLLDDILDNVESYTKVGTAAYKVTTSDDEVFVIDLNAPILANPVFGFDCGSNTGFQHVSYYVFDDYNRIISNVNYHLNLNEIY